MHLIGLIAAIQQELTDVLPHLGPRKTPQVFTFQLESDHKWLLLLESLTEQRATEDPVRRFQSTKHPCVFQGGAPAGSSWADLGLSRDVAQQRCFSDFTVCQDLEEMTSDTLKRRQDF